MAAPRFFALAALAGLLVGCAPATVAGTGSPGPGTSAPDGLARFYGQQLSWGPCAPFATTDDDAKAYADQRFTCARLTVPLDYAQPGGPTAQLGVLRLKATGQRIGSLVVNPGGPGASGMSTAASLATEITGSPLLSRFDLVGFDPRGVASSTPTIRCLTDADWTTERADLDVDPSPAGVAQTEAENRQYVQDCVERSGGTQVLATAGTREVAKDLDILRAALGDAKLTYLGYSYGTRIGSQYAEDFPRNVRALVLDGAVDPAQSSIQANIDQNKGFQQAFQAFAADCATQPGCPVGADPAQATARYQALVRPLISRPLPVGLRTLSYTDAITGTTFPLYLRSLWPALATGLARLAGGDGSTLLALADLYYGRSASGRYSNEMDAFTVVSCVDNERITDRATVLAENTQVNRVAPFEDTGLGAVGALDRCAFWPVPPTSEPHVPQVGGLPPTLVVSTTGDPATPYQAGVDLARELGGSLLTYEGTQHTAALQGIACVDKVVTQYLVTAQKAPDGVRCAAG